MTGLPIKILKIAVVISEETGKIAVAMEGILEPNLDEFALRRKLNEHLFVGSGE